jgi:hypothetical protein
MYKRPLALFSVWLMGLALFILPLTTAIAAGTILDTASGWNGSDNAIFFGSPDTSTYGETITAPITDTVLQSFTFYMQVPTALKFRGYVYAWDGTKATGSALYESAPFSTTNASLFEPITFNTAGVNLIPGQKYVLFATISKDYVTNLNQGAWGALHSDVYTGGQYVFINNGGDFSQITSRTWSNIPGATDYNPYGTGWDLAFKATFAPPPADISAPEFDLYFDKTSRTLKLATADNGTGPATDIIDIPNISSNTPFSYTLADKAGNTLKITFRRNLGNQIDTFSGIEFQCLTYTSAGVTKTYNFNDPWLTNSFMVDWSQQLGQPLTGADQSFYFQNAFNISGSWQLSDNLTRITVNGVAQPDASGLKILHVKSTNGVLSYYFV